MTNNLDLTQVTTTQNSKETTINDQSGELDAAMTEFLDSDFTSGNVTLSDSEFRRNRVHVCTNLSTARVLTCPAIKREFIVDNTAGSDTCTVTIGSGTVVVAAGELVSCYADGTTNGIVNVAGSAGPTTAPYDIGFYYPGGPPTASEVILSYVFTRSVSFADELAGIEGDTQVNPTSSFVLDFQLNSSSVGTITFNTSGVISAVTAGGGTEDFVAGDTLEVIAPGTPDATAAGIAITFKGTRTA